MDESCVRLNYEVDITADDNSDTKVWLDNFAFTGPDYPPTYGVVNGDQINLPEQSIGDNWTINGIGTMQETGMIKWAYYIEIGATGSNCEAEYEKWMCFVPACHNEVTAWFVRDPGFSTLYDLHSLSWIKLNYSP